MDKPGSNEEIQLVAILRTLRKTLEDVADILRMRKERVMFIENWLKTESLESVEGIIDDYHLKQVIENRLLKRFEEEELGEEGERHVEPVDLVRAARLTADDILQHYRKDYSQKPPTGPAPSKLELGFDQGLASLLSLAQETGSRVLSLMGQNLAAQLDTLALRVFRSFGCHDIGPKVVRDMPSVGLGQQFNARLGEALKNVESSLERRWTIQKQILIDAKSGCESLGSVDLIGNNFALAAYHFLARGDGTWLEDDHVQVLELAHVGPPCREVECPRCIYQISLQEWDTRKFICPEHEVPLIVSPRLPLPKPSVNPTSLYEESVVPIEHIALEHPSKETLSLRIPKTLPFSELVIAVGETDSMPKLRRFVQDFLQASSLREEVHRTEEGLQISYAKLLETLRSTPSADPEQSGGGDST